MLVVHGPRHVTASHSGHRCTGRAARRAHQSDLTCSSVGADARVSGAGFQSAAVSVMLIGLPAAAA